jgi:hypothetical protein
MSVSQWLTLDSVSPLSLRICHSSTRKSMVDPSPSSSRTHLSFHAPPQSHDDLCSEDYHVVLEVQAIAAAIGDMMQRRESSGGKVLTEIDAGALKRVTKEGNNSVEGPRTRSEGRMRDAMTQRETITEVSQCSGPNEVVEEENSSMNDPRTRLAEG